MRTLPLVAAAGTLAALVAAAPRARADESAWFFVGGGATAWRQQALSFAPEASMAIDGGIGTTPDGPLIFGGFFRVQPIANEGVDLAVLARVATHGFQAGKFGLALDAGAYQRFWGFGSTGFTGEVTLGAPLGLQVSLGGGYGTEKAATLMAFAGIDILRLTVYRQFGLGVWQNPSPPFHDVQAGLRRLFF
ncbi:MAG TPA: hypothetical protein VHB21_21740 [Minicystis sp.]|nr:hypothetical protein [Minicystis sp.]